MLARTTSRAMLTASQCYAESLGGLTLCDPTDCSPPAPLSMGFSRQEAWSGLLQGIFLTQGGTPSLRSPALSGRWSMTSGGSQHSFGGEEVRGQAYSILLRCLAQRSLKDRLLEQAVGVSRWGLFYVELTSRRPYRTAGRTVFSPL